MHTNPKNTKSQLSSVHRKYLLSLARQAIEDHLSGKPGSDYEPDKPIKAATSGVFVTLRKKGQLRGCIGQTTATGSTEVIVTTMAIQAAFHDWRFGPLEPDELPNITIEISLLTPQIAIDNPQQIVLGRDGIIIRKSGQSALFLPQVATENKWNLSKTLDHLCRKAGLPADAWRSDSKLFVFQAEVFSDIDFSRQ